MIKKGVNLQKNDFICNFLPLFAKKRENLQKNGRKYAEFKLKSPKFGDFDPDPNPSRFYPSFEYYKLNNQ